MSYSKWTVNLVLNTIWLIMTTLYMCKIIFFKILLNTSQTSCSNCESIIFFSQNAFMKNQSNIPSAIYVLESKH